MKKYRFIFILFCLSGCIYQIQRVSQNYLNYRTATAVDVQMDEEIMNPQLSICLNLTTLLDADFKRERFKNSSFVNLNQITDKEVLNHTPSLGALVTGCKIRGSKVRYQINHHNSSECIKLLTFDTVLHRNDICYQIGLKELNNSKKVRIPPFSYTPQDANVIFSVTIKTNSNYVYGYASEDNTSHTIDSLFFNIWNLPGSGNQNSRNREDVGSVGVLSNGTSGSARELPGSAARSPKLVVSYGIVEIKRLPLPYQTKCKDYENALSKDSRTFECINKEMNITLNKSCFSFYHETHTTTGSYLTTISDFDDEWFSANYSKIEANCTKQFPDVCTLRFTFSDSIFIPGHQVANGGGGHDVGHELTAILSLPQSPSVKVRHEAAQNLEDFLCLVSSCFGTWLGMSALSGLDIPMALMVKLVEKKMKKRSQKVSSASFERKRKEEEVVNIFDEKLHPKLMRDVSFLVSALLRVERDRNMLRLQRTFVRRVHN